MFVLPDLPYGYAALGRVISEATLRVHHDKHHARYVAVTNELLVEAGAAYRPLEDVMTLALRRGDQKLFNNAAQTWNHAFFWECMTPDPVAPGGTLAEAISTQFGSFDALRDLFLSEGAAHFGSGWVWLVAEGDKLSVRTTHDAGSPITDGLTPLLVCDLWEHAYYLDYKNDRGAFLRAWWDKAANWPLAESQYRAAQGGDEAWRFPRPVELEVG